MVTVVTTTARAPVNIHPTFVRETTIVRDRGVAIDAGGERAVRGQAVIGWPRVSGSRRVEAFLRAETDGYERIERGESKNTIHPSALWKADFPVQEGARRTGGRWPTCGSSSGPCRWCP